GPGSSFSFTRPGSGWIGSPPDRAFCPRPEVVDVMWKHRVLAQASDLETTPPTLPPRQAQPWCNFAVWTPEGLPGPYVTVTGTLRKESPPGIPQAETAGRTPWSANNPCAYRFEVRGPGGRVRVKQFLYDWAFPALDHPCLWDSSTRAVAIDDRHVLW